MSLPQPNPSNPPPVKDEYDALIENKIRDLVSRPSNANVIWSLSIFKHKKKSYGLLTLNINIAYLYDINF
jgi:hypothetical protein